MGYLEIPPVAKHERNFVVVAPGVEYHLLVAFM